MDQQQSFDRLLNKGIKAHGREIARIAVGGGIAAVVFEPAPSIVNWLKVNLNWNGEPMFRLSAKERQWLAEAWQNVGDEVSARWIRGKSGKGRIFVFSGKGTLLINWSPGEGFSLEPGSTDAERVKQLH